MLIINILIDGLPLFLNKWDLGEYLKTTIVSLANIDYLNIHLVKDIQLKEQYLAPKIKVFNTYLNRKADNYSPIVDYMDISKIDFYHCFNNGFSFNEDMKNKKCIATIHHLINLDYKKYYPESYIKKYFNSIYNTINTSTKIICPSYTMKNDLINFFSADEDKIEVIYPGVSEDLKPLNKYMSSVYLESKFNIPKDFILCAGDFHRRKQIGEVLEVFSNFLRENRTLYLVFLTAINSFNIEYFNEINTLAKAMEIDSNIIFVPNFTVEEKVHFFNSALCYIDFSLYDGLNYSILHAFRCKCPIICSDIPIFHELLGSNAIYIDFENENAHEIIEDYFFNLQYINLYSNNEYIKKSNNYSLEYSIDSLLNFYKNMYL